nr:uncharacterized protein [Tanacetum cinerariifolium]
MGQQRFHNSTTATLDYVVKQSKDTSYKLNNVLDILETAKGIGVDQVSLPESIKDNIDRVDTMVNEAATDLEFETADNQDESIKDNIDRVDTMVNEAATDLEFETSDNQDGIQYVLNSVRLSLIIIAAVMLLVALLGFLLSIFGLQVLVYVLVVFGWILVTSTFILCGIFLTLHNIMGDTCVAMDEWVQNPTAHTALDEILPCVDNATAQETLYESKDVTFQLVWKGYLCQVSAQDTCTTVGRLTPKMYDQMSAAANVTSGLTQYGPFLVGLLDCTFVRDTFTGIHKDHCPDLTKYSRWVYIGLAMVSVAVLLSLVLWVLYARERRHRVYTKRVLGEKRMEAK